MAAAAARHPPLFPADPGLPDTVELLAGGGARPVARFLSERGLDGIAIAIAIGPIWPGGRRIACCAWLAGPSGSCIPSGPAG